MQKKKKTKRKSSVKGWKIDEEEEISEGFSRQGILGTICFAFEGGNCRAKRLVL